MPGFVREHMRPLAGSAGLHLLLLALLAGAALRWTTSQPPVQLAIEGTIVDARSLPPSMRPGNPKPPPAAATPAPPEPLPQPAPVPEPDRRAEQQAAEAKAAQEAVERERAAEALKLKKAEEVEQKHKADEAALKKKQAEDDAKRKATEEAEKKKAEAAETKRKQAEAAKAAQDARARQEHEADLKRALAEEEESGAAASAARKGAVDEYRALLTQAIERNWIRPPSAKSGLECTLYVSQAPGGTVTDVKLGACNGDQSVRESIVNAVYRASPLPPPRDPHAFERKLEIVFKPME